jgi:hypothetical protein
MNRPAVVILAAVVAACGSASVTAPPTAVPSIEASVPPIPSPSPTPAPTPTARPTPVPTPGIGDQYIDPEGAYEIRVDPDWAFQAGGFVEGVEFWFLGPPENGLTPNVNVLTQRTGGLSLDDFTKMSIDAAPQLVGDFDLVSLDQFEVAGEPLAILDYTGVVQGNKLHFLAVWGVRGDRAVVATLTAPTKTFATWKAVVEPYLRTLRLT